ncbi:hypothetical protein [Thermococcus sp.]|jgi:hypothetical protein|uniref:hypothetical protein n=1 Tax=Thermococcus sp. TaxID=35749 RepID=UPI00261324D7|nr:hypothetical protein [Thermococcus sp.]
MVVLSHNTIGYLTFAVMTLSMLSGALILLSKRRGLWIKVHILLSVVAYILMVWTIWIVR